MAGTIQTGNIGTEEPLPDERVVDMDDKIRTLDPEETQFTTLSSKLGARVATREKVNWLEEEDFPRTVTAAGAQTASSGALVLTAGQGKIVQANDMIRNMRTGEMSRIVTVTTDTLSLNNGVGSIAAAAVNSGDVFLVTSDAQPQGSNFPTPRYLARVLGYNYTQITRTPWGFTGTTTAIELYGGREPAKEARRKAREHKKKWETIGFFGARSFLTSAPPENEPQGSAGGAIEFIQTIKRDWLAGSTGLTPDFFDLFAQDVMAHGNGDGKVFFCAPKVAAAMSKWNRNGMGQYWEPTPQNVHGVKVDAFINGAYGYRVPVIVKREWASFPSPGYGSYGFLLDMDYIERRPLRDRDTKLLTEQQPKGKDSYNAEYITEATYEFAHERCHGYIYSST